MVATNERPLFKRAIETEALADFLGEWEDHENCITYEQLSEVAGINVTGQKGRGYLQTAREAVLREKGKYFETVWRTGLRLLTQEEIASKKTTEAINVHHRRLRRDFGRIDNGIHDFDGLTVESKSQVNMARSIYAVVDNVLSKKSQKRVLDVCQQVYKPLPIAKTVAAFLENGKS
jgi:hypothetical protein